MDGLRVDGLYGVIALVGGRGVDALLLLLSMTVAIARGRVLARGAHRTFSAAGRRHLVRRGLLAGATLAVLALTLGLLRTAGTHTVVGADGARVHGSIAELVDVLIVGHDQAVMLRAVSTKSPVLIFLEGGPGGTGVERIWNPGEDLGLGSSRRWRVRSPTAKANITAKSTKAVARSFQVSQCRWGLGSIGMESRSPKAPNSRFPAIPLTSTAPASSPMWCRTYGRSP